MKRAQRGARSSIAYGSTTSCATPPRPSCATHRMPRVARGLGGGVPAQEGLQLARPSREGPAGVDQPGCGGRAEPSIVVVVHEPHTPAAAAVAAPPCCVAAWAEWGPWGAGPHAHQQHTDAHQQHTAGLGWGQGQCRQSPATVGSAPGVRTTLGGPPAISNLGLSPGSQTNPR